MTRVRAIVKRCGAVVAILTLISIQAVAAQTETKPFTLTIKPPPSRLVLIANDRTSFAISSSQEAKNLHVIHSSLQDQSTGVQLAPSWLHVCLPDAAECSGFVDLPAGTSTRVDLQVDRNLPVRGVFAGTVTLGVDAHPEMSSFDLTVLATSTCSRVAGAALILLGIVLSLFVSLFLRQQAQRADLLVPASELGEVLVSARERVERIRATTGQDLPRTKARLSQLLTDLSPRTLEQRGWLPPLIPSPFRAASDTSSTYRQFLADQALRVAAVLEVVEGEVRAADRFAAHAVAVQTALSALDALANTVQTVDEARAGIGPIMTTLNAALAPPPVPALAPAPPAAPPTVRELRVQLSRLNASMWLVWAGLTWLVGLMSLVITNDGFGITLDYFKCFFWGLGVQIAGQQLQQLAPTTITTAFNVSIPK